MRHVVLPQGPARHRGRRSPASNLNLTKNSSLAVAIGYPDWCPIANTIINQTGQAIEGIAIIMAVYLTISLSILGVHELVQRAPQMSRFLSAVLGVVIAFLAWKLIDWR